MTVGNFQASLKTAERTGSLVEGPRGEVNRKMSASIN